METPAGKADELATLIERDLADFGFDVETTASVIENYLSVQDTYMAAFQTLGGMGLLLGTLGLGAVVLRNVTERRQELALLSAVGFPPTSVAVMVLAETLFLLLAGLAIGLLCALVAVAPQLARLKDWSVMLPLAILLLAIVAAGLGSGWAAVRSALRVPVLSALRVERA
jgi:ABC-type antimicrobial peptide transport system permease subunit